MICSYRDCTNIQRPCSKIAFFALPKDERRQKWITNSGNSLLDGISINSRRIFCENHFDEKCFRRQFNRTILSRDAVPKPHFDSENEDRTETETESDPETENVQNEIIDCGSDCEYLDCDLPDNSTTKSNIIDEILNDRYIEPQSYQESNCSSENSISEAHSNDLDVQNEPNNIELRYVLAESIDFDDSTILCESIEHDVDDVLNLNEINSITERENIESVDDNEQNLPKIQLSSEEKYFAFSVFGTLRRLRLKQRQTAQLNILTYLAKLEYGENATLD